MTFEEFVALLPCPEWFGDGKLWPSCQEEPSGQTGYLAYFDGEIVYTPPTQADDTKPDDRPLHTLEEIFAAASEIRKAVLVLKLRGGP